ncbi:MAG: carboxypeptidase-like regulatory domain-containing protein [Planctomycetota bacterium]
MFKNVIHEFRVVLMTAICAGISLTGCGRGDMPELGDVHGKVTLDGKPVAGINILFTPETGRPAGGQTDEEGNYELNYLDGYSGCKIGPAQVTFEWSPGVEASAPVPARYMKEGYSVEVKAGSNEMNFPMESK